MFEEQIAHGMEKLDGHFGGVAWWERIDLRTLDLDDYCDCVLGQLFGEYTPGRRKLGILGFDSGDYGFTVPHDFDYQAHTMRNTTAYAVLTEEWKAALQKKK